MRKLERRVLALSLGVFLMVYAESVHATIDTPVVVSTPGAAILSTYIYNHIILQALAAFWGISFFALFYYAARMILFSHSDEASKEMSTSVIYALVGFGVISCSLAFATIFTTSGLSLDTTADIQPLLAKRTIDSVRQFLITLSTGVFVLIVVVASLRMITSQGDEANFDKARKVLIGSCAGVMLMFIADFIVQAVDGRNALLIVEELKGIALFLLTFAGFLCVLALLVAGIFLIISIEEGLRDRAKKTIIGTLIALVIVICSYAIILTFVPGGTTNTIIN